MGTSWIKSGQEGGREERVLRRGEGEGRGDGGGRRPEAQGLEAIRTTWDLGPLSGRESGQEVGRVSPTQPLGTRDLGPGEASFIPPGSSSEGLLGARTGAGVYASTPDQTPCPRHPL